jgi:anti-sigma B factor antagonist
MAPGISHPQHQGERSGMAQEAGFTYEVEESEDENKWHTTRVCCHGRLVSGNTAQIRGLVKPMIARGGRIIVDLADLNYLDSSGLGALVGLKVSAIHQGLCRLELENLTPRIRELLSMTNLQQLFTK